MIDQIVAFEIMRAAADNRRPVWAVAIAAAVRLHGIAAEALRAKVCSEVRRLVAAGDVFVFRVPRFWGAERVLSEQEIESALADDRVWRPRLLSVASVPRLGITEKGKLALKSGDFGRPSPIVWYPDWFDKGEVGPTAEPDLGQILTALLGAIAGALIHAVLNPLWGGQGATRALLGADVVAFTLAGLVAGVLLWNWTRRAEEAPCEWDFRLPIYSVDDLGDRRF